MAQSKDGTSISMYTERAIRENPLDFELPVVSQMEQLSAPADCPCTLLNMAASKQASTWEQVSILLALLTF